MTVGGGACRAGNLPASLLDIGRTRRGAPATNGLAACPVKGRGIRKDRRPRSQQFSSSHSMSKLSATALQVIRPSAMFTPRRMAAFSLAARSHPLLAIWRA